MTKPTFSFNYSALIVFLMLCLTTKAFAGKWISFQDTGIVPAPSIPDYSLKPELNCQDSGRNGITMEFQIPGAFVSDVKRGKNKFQYVNIEGFGKINDVGKPAVPQRIYSIAVPRGATPRINILKLKSRKLKGFKIHPALEPPLDKIGAPEPEFTIDTQFYSSDQLYPESPVSIVGIRKMRGIEIARICIAPVQFNPVDSELVVHSQIAFRVTFEGANEEISLNTPLLRKTLPNIVANPAIFKDERSTDGSTDQRVLIVSTSTFEQAVDSLAIWKSQTGYRVFTVVLSEWTGSDQVKDTIHHYASDHNIDFFTIIGDHEHVPSELSNTTDSIHVTDLYYACLDGNGDYIPDLAYGRIPVSNLNQANTVVQKIINYERNPVSNPDFYENGLTAAYFQEDEENTGYAGRRFAQTACEIRDYLIGLGYSIDRVFYTESAVSPLFWNDGTFSSGEPIPDSLRKPNCTWDGNAADIIKGINAGRFFILHRDHGSVSRWGDPSFTQSNIRSLSNGNLLPVVFSMNCLTGKFDHSSEVFAETFLRKENGGAVGVIAATQVSYSGLNDGMALGLIDAIWPEPGLVPSFPHNRNPSVAPHDTILEMGAVLNQGKLRMSETWGNYYSRVYEQYTYELFHYLGDPTMKIWTTVPREISAMNESSLSVGQTTYALYNLSCSTAMATIWFKGKIIGRGKISGVNAQLAIDSVATDTGKAILTITAPNHRPLIRELDVIESEPAILIQSPTASDTFDVGEIIPITWITYNTVANVQVQYSIDSGKSFINIEDSIPNTGVFNWVAPVIGSSECLVRVMNVGEGEPSDTSQSFRIIDLSSITGTITPALNAEVYFSGIGISGRVNADNQGNFSIAKLVPGTYQVFAKAGDYMTDTVSVTIPPDVVVNLTVQCPSIAVSPASINDTVYAGSTRLDSITISNTKEGILQYAISSVNSNAARKVMINEVCNSADFIELWNQGCEIDINGWIVRWVDDVGTSGSFQFPSGTVVAAGKCIVIRENSGTNNDSTFYLGNNLDWVQSTEISVALVDQNGVGIDFMRTAGSTSTPPSGTQWYGTGIAHSGYSIYRNRNVDTDGAGDWIDATVHSEFALNLGESFTQLQSPVLFFSPTSGNIHSGASQNVQISIDVSGIPAGLYLDTVMINHNDPSKPTPYRMPLSINLASSRKLEITPSNLSFGNIMVGTNTTLSVLLKNSGNDTTVISDISSDNIVFLHNEVLPLSLPPFSSKVLTVIFSPWRVSEETGTLKITSNSDSPVLDITVDGKGVSGPEITGVPENIRRVMMISDSAEVSLHLCNPGGSTLIYNLQGQNTGDDRYTWIDSDAPNGPKFEWSDISGTGTPLTLLDDDYELISLNFSFPFFGNNYTTMYVNSNGYISFGAGATTRINSPIPSTAPPGNFIAAFWDDLDPGTGGSVYYKNTDSSTIVQFDHVLPYRGTSPNDYTFQIVLSDDGSIGIYYLKMYAGLLNSATAGIENKDGTDGIQVMYNEAYIHDSLAVLFRKSGPWLANPVTAGSVTPGDCRNHTMLLRSAGLPLGEYSQNLWITHNDPSKVSPLVIPCTLVVIDSTLPVISFIDTFMEVEESSDTVLIQMSLSRPDTVDIQVPFFISGTALNGTDFSTSSSPVSIPAGQLSAQILVCLIDDNQAEGDETFRIQLGPPNRGIVGNNAVCTLSIKDNESILSIVEDGCGLAIPSGDSVIHEGEVFTVKAISSGNCFFDSWSLVSGMADIENPSAEQTLIRSFGQSTTINARFVPGGSIELVGLGEESEVYLYTGSGYYGKYILSGPGIISSVKPGNQIVTIIQPGKRAEFVHLNVISGDTVRDTVSLRDPVPLLFNEKQPFTVGQVPVNSGLINSASYGDIDGDGDSDLLVLPKDGILSIYKNEKNELTSAIQLQTGISEPTCLRLTDWDGDGHQDILISSYSGYIYSFLGIGGGAFTDSQTVFDCKGQCSGFDMDEINGDGQVDFLIGRPDGTISIAISDNDGWNFSETKLKDGTNIDIGMDAAPLSMDLSGDGVNDIVVGAAGGNVQWFRKGKDSTYVSEGLVITNGAGLCLADAARLSKRIPGEGELPAFILSDGSGNVWKMTSRLKGDFDNNGKVEFNDYLVLTNAWGLTEMDTSWIWDVNISLSTGTQTIDFSDFMYFISSWGKNR